MSKKTTELPTLQLRPSIQVAEVQYMREPEEVGLLVDRSNQIALLTSRSVPAVGPQGPPGVDQNSWFDTIIASASDEFTPIVAGATAKTTFRAPYPLSFDTPGYEGYIRCSLTNAPTGGPMHIRVTANGVNCTTVPIQIDAGSKTSVGSVVAAPMAIANVPDDAEFLVYVDLVGTEFAGSGLKVAVTGIKTDLVP